ncbi:isoprenylcysteine carboxylmethyltransferase family protein [Phocaeicola salanitronis]|uniref:methyltransferase family protein n=1 Tax=Phocaeicola salanitronis TaxID=376805 RepID=UPI0023F858BE|nr:isoprenylcysteine carboxylmethyltransferase family protein [Phocaeicola salanitronis]
MAGTFIRIYTVGHTPVHTSGRNTAGQVADSLNTTGIYSIVRHPLYLGNFLMWFGISLLTCNGGFIIAFILAYWLYYERIMYAEEDFLRRKFGVDYLRWAERTPAFIPNFKLFKPSDLPFSWKKVAKKRTAYLPSSCCSACLIL